MRNRDLDLLWTRSVVRWLEENLSDSPSKESLRLLDYGCGWYVVGGQLAEHGFHCDGYEPDEELVVQTKKNLPAGSPAVLTHQIGELSAYRYDLIFMNSVVQYFQGEQELDEFFKRSAAALKPGARVLISDLIPTQYSALKDVIRSLFVSTQNGLGMDMLKALFEAKAQWKKRPVFQINFDQICAVAQKYGLRGTRLEKNLTPSLQRYSVVFHS